MGGLFTKLWKKIFSSKRTYKLLMLGLANAGKTTILYKLYA